MCLYYERYHVNEVNLLQKLAYIEYHYYHKSVWCFDMPYSEQIYTTPEAYRLTTIGSRR